MTLVCFVFPRQCRGASLACRLVNVWLYPSPQSMAPAMDPGMSCPSPIVTSSTSLLTTPWDPHEYSSSLSSCYLYKRVALAAHPCPHHDDCYTTIAQSSPLIHCCPVAPRLRFLTTLPVLLIYIALYLDADIQPFASLDSSLSSTIPLDLELYHRYSYTRTEGTNKKTPVTFIADHGRT